MSKKTFTILITLFIIFCLIVFGVIWYRNVQKENGGVTPTLKDFFPFGKGSPISTGNTTNPGQTQSGSTPSSGSQPIPRLRKVSDNPVIGYIATSENVPVDPNNIPPPKQTTVTATTTFSKDLKLGTVDPDVTFLQQELNQCPQTQVAKTGAGSPGKEGTRFGAATQAAVIAFQNLFPDDILKPQNLTKGSGVVDQLTRTKLNAGFTCTWPQTTATTITEDVVRYVEAGTSNIFQAIASTLDKTRLSNTTIPRVHQALFAGGGSTVILRSLESDNNTIDTFIATIPEPVAGGDALPRLTGASMPQDIEDISVSPDGKQLLFLTPNGTNLLGFISDITGANQKKIFSSPFFGWLSQWSTPKQVVFTAKASGQAPGYAYATNVAAGDFVKIAGPITGLTTLQSPDGKYLLMSKQTDSGPDLEVQTIGTNTILDLNAATFPEKCTWNATSTEIYCAVPNFIPQGMYPDDWYQGKVIFSDDFWEFDPTGVIGGQKLFDPLGQGGELTDGTYLSVDTANKYLYFINKDTKFLWQYDLNPTPIAPATPQIPTTTPATTPTGVTTATSASTTPPTNTQTTH